MKKNVSLIILGLVLAIACVFVPYFIGLSDNIIGAITMGYFCGIGILIPKLLILKNVTSKEDYWLQMILGLIVLYISLRLIFNIAGHIFNKTFFEESGEDFLLVSLCLFIGYFIGTGYRIFLCHTKGINEYYKES
ncbi:TPA: hypothetical protein DCX66_03595 [Candidatus Nomurabacteria bacterium]|uniref:Uncharacterized protein n=1 Tax=Candidatus Nomurabacteria bacterium GW2011_GWE1_35_16 TaxID=1618761 RepID=A0A0G0DV93_9BACT|nr:MAG: hypothetical protein UR55_C0001G0029 [Candidatus Nomurabacteria bacterium GW2011_GWF1_34_20]KKP63738.1 MAG: hypothetical protein UR57_C0001G0029 [Candidatus Nomurabacteria bacterium GW2011_GWE2_34_25]KKP66950.1 MAG: hypothetical protein UR64_C0001G0029 [Candidatus Nomurabacteria bacterium GW2011_GWE1_35_16]HAE36774.1 hypothetical protein [Candidatus Nomurabacteria bacterium]HAX65523.1 hypothetical protein [Candidatus Nomurabacteria bacterium]